MIALVILQLSLLTSASPIQETVKPKSNPSNANVGRQRQGNQGDLAFRQSMFGRELVNKVKKGAIYIWAMTPGPAGMFDERWIGSGFIFQAIPEENAAYALTNHHVAQGTTALQCETWDHSTYKAEFVALEPGIDVALIKILDIAPGSYEVNVLGDSDKVQIGDPALAIGAPGSAESRNSDRTDPYITAGLHQTATMRVVSGKQTDPMEFVQTRPFWQADLASNEVLTNLPWRFVCQSTINGGNSGGPLYNANGEVIGLNHAHANGTPQEMQNENLTIPINFAKNFAYQIINTGRYEIPWLGMDILIPPSETHWQGISQWAERYYDPKRLEVLGVRHDSPAERAGLKTGDRVIDLDGQKFPNSTELRMYIFQLPIGKHVQMTVKRGGRKVSLDLEVGPKRKYDSEFSF